MKNTKHKTLFIIGALIAMTIIIYLMSNSTTNLEQEQNPFQITKLEDSPKEVYLNYKKAIENSQDFDEYIEVMLAYAVTSYKKEIEKGRDIAPEMKDFAFNIVQNSSIKLKDITEISEEINENTATLEINTTYENIKGEILMTKENNVWKLATDHWIDTKKPEETILS